MAVTSLLTYTVAAVATIAALWMVSVYAGVVCSCTAGALVLGVAAALLIATVFSL